MKPFSDRLGTTGDVEAIARLIASMGADALGSPELGVDERIERLHARFEALDGGLPVTERLRLGALSVLVGGAH
jgi:hypothetical protein